tara:strand:- start:792 stop:1202 length:411 start_codon:yes stop_codon:yes gene_type:complete
MTAVELANKLHGMNYPLSLSKELLDTAKASGLVIVTGASDDIMSINGALTGEGDVYDGGKVLVHRDAVLEDRDNLESDEELQDYYSKKPEAKVIEAFWYRGDYKWSYDTEIPHVTFELLKDGEKCCLGIVFSVSDL